jgi:hypothetical protein
MLCRACGTEIADKAIVCYRCGAPTAAPSPAAGPRRGRAFPWGAAAAVIALVAAAILLAPRVPAGAPRLAAYAGLALVIILIVRLAIRPRAR